jgi:hypothetical protein
MRIFPSSLAAIVTGAVILPVFMWVMNLLVAVLQPGVLLLGLQLLWGIVAFFIPVAGSTMDFRHVRRRQRELGGGIFQVLASREDFSELYVPAWIRMGVLILSAVFSMLILERIGVNI